MTLQEMTLLIDKTKALQNPNEVMFLIDFMSKIQPKIILEIGVWRGGLASIFSYCFPDSRVIGVDILDVNDEGMVNGEHVYPYLDRNIKTYLFEYIHGNRHDESTVEKVKQSLGGKMPDFVFIDAGHDYESVKKDYELYGLMGKYTGFHDLFDLGGTKKLWEEKLIREHDCWYFKSLKGMGIGIIEVKK